MARGLDPEKRERFLEAALALFAEKGIQHTSTAEIAGRAGAAAGTLFLYFPTRQELLDALVMKVSVEQSSAIKAALEPGFSAREVFLTIWSGSIHWFLRNMAAFVFVQQVREGGLVSPQAVRESGLLLEYYFQALQKGAVERSIHPYPPELVGEILYQDIVAVVQHIRRLTDRTQVDAAIGMGFDIFWNGIKAHPEGMSQSGADLKDHKGGLR